MRIGQTLTVTLRTPAISSNPGTLRNADSLPSVVMLKNGSASGLTTLPTIASPSSAGRYKVQFTFTATEWSDGDCYDLYATWTMESVSGFEMALAQGEVEADPFLTGTVSDGSPTAGGFTAAAGLSADDSEYVGMLVVFLDGPARGLNAKVTGYTGLTRAFAFSTPLTQAPLNGNHFWIIGRAT